MATIPEGVNAEHFDIMFDHWGETLTLNRYDEKTSNISGNSTSDNYSDDESITGILVKREQSFKLEKSGFVERGDAFLMLKYADHSADPPSGKDKIAKSDGETFEIEDVINRRDLYYFCRLYKVD